MNMRDAGNVLRTLTALTMRDAGNTQRVLKSLTMRDAGNVLRTIYATGGGGGGGGGGAGGVNPTTAEGYGDSIRPIRVVTGYCGVTVTGASYQWTTADSGWTALAPNNPSTNFRSPPLGAGVTTTAQFYCTVTFANGATATYGPVTATAENYGTNGGQYNNPQ